jgi:hypothetical protein
MTNKPKIGRPLEDWTKKPCTSCGGPRTTKHANCNNCLAAKMKLRRNLDPERHKAALRRHYHRDIEASRAYAREHYRANRDARIAAAVAWRRAHPAKRDAFKEACRSAVRAALSVGVLVRPGKCSSCGSACQPHGHHRDYSKPLEVEWLCRPCHGIRHRKAGVNVESVRGKTAGQP